MHATTLIEHDANLCVWRVKGAIALEALRTSYLERFELSGWWPGMHNLTIFTDARLDLLNPGEAESLMRYMATAAAEHGVKASFYAAVVCADPDSRAMLTYWERRAPAGLSGDNRIFSNEAEAREWLSRQS